MKVGDLVRWVPHSKWDHAGLGTIVETTFTGCRIMWHVDIEDITGYKGVWYITEEFDDGKIVKV